MNPHFFTEITVGCKCMIFCYNGKSLGFERDPEPEWIVWLKFPSKYRSWQTWPLDKIYDRYLESKWWPGLPTISSMISHQSRSSLFLGSSKRTFFRLKIIFMKWIWILISFVGQTIFWKVLSPSDEMWSFYFENETGDPESKRRSEKHSQIQLGVHFWELIFFDTLQIGFWDVRHRHLWCVSGTECFEIRCASAEYFAAGGKWCYALKATGSWNKLLKCFKMSSGVVRYKLHLCDAEICAFCRYWFHLAPFLRLSVRIMNSERRRALCNARIALDLCSKVKTDPKQKQVVKMCRNSFNSFRVLSEPSIYTPEMDFPGRQNQIWLKIVWKPQSQVETDQWNFDCVFCNLKDTTEI